MSTHFYHKQEIDKYRIVYTYNIYIHGYPKDPLPPITMDYLRVYALYFHQIRIRSSRNFDVFKAVLIARSFIVPIIVMIPVVTIPYFLSCSRFVLKYASAMIVASSFANNSSATKSIFSARINSYISMVFHSFFISLE